MNYLVTLEFPFTYPSLYNPPFSTLCVSFVQFNFVESEKSPRVRVLLVIFKRREDLVPVFKIFHYIEVCWVRKTFLSMKNQTSHLFSQHKHFFINFKTFSFIELHETHSFTTDCKNTFSQFHKRHLIIEWNIFLDDPAWKFHHMNPCSIFMFLVELSPSA